MATSVRRRGRWVYIAMVVAVAVAAVGCGDDDRDDGAGEGALATPKPYASMARAVCTAADRAARGDTAGARRAFFDGAHQPLHDLAAETAERDRAATARLLEAKEAAESAFESGDVAAAFEPLVGATAGALRVIDGATLPCAGSAPAS